MAETNADRGVALVLATLPPECDAKCVTAAEAQRALALASGAVVWLRCWCAWWLGMASQAGDVCPVCGVPLVADRRRSNTVATAATEPEGEAAA